MAILLNPLTLQGVCFFEKSFRINKQFERFSGPVQEFSFLIFEEYQGVNEQDHFYRRILSAGRLVSFYAYPADTGYPYRHSHYS
jgi:hypothetical protein